MLIVSESPQNYKNIAECNQLTDVGREGCVPLGVCESVEGVQGYSVNTIVYLYSKNSSLPPKMLNTKLT
jgi:hypothetical protein